MSLDQDITFFYSDKIEHQTLEPVACEAADRGYQVRFTDRLLQRAEIGFYCQHLARPSRSKFSVAMLHDMAQRHCEWPNIWRLEPWDGFDLAILPGKAWAERWQSASAHPYSHPRHGVYELGWPKADSASSSMEKDCEKKAKLREQLSLKYSQAVLYAPSWENDGKQDSFVQSLKNLPVDLLLKQAPWPESYPQVLRSIAEMNSLHADAGDNVHIIDPNLNIFDCLLLADIVVSEESSVLLEGLLRNVPSISVDDWFIPDTKPPRPPSFPFDFTSKTTIANLEKTVREMLEHLDQQWSVTEQNVRNHFSNIGGSSKLVMDVIDHHVKGSPLDLAPVQPTQSLTPVPLMNRLDRLARSTYFLLKYSI